jgi:hypothetical protein
MTRPSETISAVAASVLGALLIILGGFDVKVVERLTPEVMGAIVLLVGWIGAVVTAYIARRQRAGALPSSPDGTVQ